MGASKKNTMLVAKSEIASEIEPEFKNHYRGHSLRFVRIFDHGELSRLFFSGLFEYCSSQSGKSGKSKSQKQEPSISIVKLAEVVPKDFYERSKPALSCRLNFHGRLNQHFWHIF
jgi:hypothetical protein